MAFTLPQIITEPFCNGGSPGEDYIIPPKSSADNTIMTQDIGYPPLQATPFSLGGVPIDRAQTNGAFNLYSSIITWINAGGVFTFDQTGAIIAAGGYNQGAILWASSVNRFLISLKDNNIANFVVTPSFINDGINWKYAELPGIIDNGSIISVYGVPTQGAGIIAEGSNSNGNWRKFANGDIEQWGSWVNPSGASARTVIFPISFLVGVQNIICPGFSQNNTIMILNNVNPVTTTLTNFTVTGFSGAVNNFLNYNTAAGAVGGYWRAIGK